MGRSSGFGAWRHFGPVLMSDANARCSPLMVRPRGQRQPRQCRRSFPAVFFVRGLRNPLLPLHLTPDRDVLEVRDMHKYFTALLVVILLGAMGVARAVRAAQHMQGRSRSIRFRDHERACNSDRRWRLTRRRTAIRSSFLDEHLRVLRACAKRVGGALSGATRFAPQ